MQKHLKRIQFCIENAKDLKSMAILLFGKDRSQILYSA